MARVPLLFRGVAVLLLAASTVVAQSPEPPAELLSLDSVGSEPPDFLRQFSADARHPLLSLMVDGELTTFETAAPQESAKLKPTPQTSKAAPKGAAADECVLEGGQVEGGLFAGGALGNACSAVSNCFPFACAPPPPCNCRKCQRQRRHGHGHGGGQGNPYLNWPTCPAWCFYGAPLEPCNQGCGRRRCGHRRGCGNQGYGYGGGWGEGFFDGGCGFGGYMPQQSCGCRRCQRRHHQQGCGYGGGWDMGCGFCGAYMAPQQSCGGRKHHRRHGCSSGYGCGYGGWGMGYGGMESCYGYGSGCGNRHGRHHRGRRCQQQAYPYCSYSMMSGIGGGSFGGGYAFGGDGFAGEGIVGDGFAGDGFVADGMVGASGFEPIVSSTDN